MKHLLARMTSGGNHGHQLKDLLGAYSLAIAFDLNWVTNYDPYLDFFGLSSDTTVLADIPPSIAYQRFRGPHWPGISPVALKRFSERVHRHSGSDLLISVENAFRLLPHQTIKYAEAGLVPRGTFDEITNAVACSYRRHHGRSDHPDRQSTTSVAIHVSRPISSSDSERHKAEGPWNTRWVFEPQYYATILDQLAAEFGASAPHQFVVYTEHSTPDEFMAPLVQRGAIVKRGPDRENVTNPIVAEIFDAFVSSDVLVASNSSFSAMATYFRDKMPTIYHPHAHLNGLTARRFVATNEHGQMKPHDLASALDAL